MGIRGWGWRDSVKNFDFTPHVIGEQVEINVGNTTIQTMVGVGGKGTSGVGFKILLSQVQAFYIIRGVNRF